MSIGYPDPLPGDSFEVLGQLPITWVDKKELEQNFRTYEENKLQPLKTMQPAAILRIREVNKTPSWDSCESWDVNPKTQEILKHGPEQGFLEEIDQGKKQKLKDFALEATSGEDPISEEDMFKGKVSKGMLYVNDIPLDRSRVIDGDWWTLFGNLGLENLGGVSGISSPWGYAGTRGSAFPVHVEDSNLGSMNVHLKGAIKIWYVIHPNLRERFIEELKKLYPNQYEECKQYHQHKRFWINPLYVQKIMDIPVYRIKQRPGDLVVTWAGAFHWGFNTGNNASMAVNYCPKGDFESERIIKTAKICCPTCEDPTIVLPVEKLFAKTPKAFYCDECPKSFTASATLIRHKRDVHKKNVKHGDVQPVKCPVKSCGKKVMKLDDHLRIHRNVAEIPKLPNKTPKAFGCDKCHKGFTAPATLIRHKRDVHEENVNIGDIKPVKCPEKGCGKKVKKLDDHMRTHKK
jgi:hypothetical protein